jgi:hypothetical protein
MNTVLYLKQNYFFKKSAVFQNPPFYQFDCSSVLCETITQTIENIQTKIECCNTDRCNCVGTGCNDDLSTTRTSMSFMTTKSTANFSNKIFFNFDSKLILLILSFYMYL